MQRRSITLIATRHKESGECTSNELYRIIDQIAPDVIFEEVPPSKFDSVYKGLLRDSLETNAIKRYLEKQSIAHVPVDADIDEITDTFTKSDHNAMVNLFGRHSPEYRSLFHQRQHFADDKGFPFLNSESWTLLSKRMDALEEEVIKSIDNDKLNQRYKDWSNQLDVRDNEMIRNIYKYVENNRCEKGLFLVGVEHRRQLMIKIPEFEKSHHLKIDWNFDYFNDKVKQIVEF
jgi:hypothetical protein